MANRCRRVKPTPKAKTSAAHLDFKTSKGEQIILRVGLSPTSVEEAKKNLQTEMPTWDFDAVRLAARKYLERKPFAHRNRSLQSGLSPDVLFLRCITPWSRRTLYNDADDTYRGTDKQIHSADFQDYSTFSMWDIFRAEAPLLMLTEPERVNDFVKSMLAFYQQSPDHALPVWPLANYETGCMIGYHSIPIICDAYVMGFRGFDAELAFQAMRGHGHERPQPSGRIPEIRLCALGAKGKAQPRRARWN